MKVDVKDLWFDYGNLKVLREIDFSMENEFVGIVGPNGCGKTTLLKLLARILVPGKGAVIIDEREIGTLSTREVGRRVSLLPQTSPLTFAFTAFDIVLMGRNPHLERLQSSGPKDFRIVENAMRLTKIWDLRDRFVTELSGGESQKVLIARALAQEPRILLLDEPTAHLDFGAQLEILELIKGLNTDEGIGVMAVFHDLNIAARFCTRLLLVHKGRILSTGVPKDVLTVENVKRVYNVDARISLNRDTKSIQITPLSVASAQEEDGT